MLGWYFCLGGKGHKANGLGDMVNCRLLVQPKITFDALKRYLKL